MATEKTLAQLAIMAPVADRLAEVCNRKTVKLLPEEAADGYRLPQT